MHQSQEMSWSHNLIVMCNHITHDLIATVSILTCLHIGETEGQDSALLGTCSHTPGNCICCT